MDHPLLFLKAFGSWVVLGGVFLDLTLLPFPSEILLVLAGSLAVSGQLRLGVLILAGTFGALLADHLWFFLGRRRAGPTLRLLCRVTGRPPHCEEKAVAFFARFGRFSLLVAKFFPGLRTIVPSLAGAAALSYGAFLRADGVGTSLWVIAFSGLGYVLAGQIRDLLAALQGVQAAALWIVGGIAVGLSVFGQVWARRRIRCLAPAAAMRLASPREGSPSAPRALESTGQVRRPCGVGEKERTGAEG